jgi:cytochrome P450
MVVQTKPTSQFQPAEEMPGSFGKLFGGETKELFRDEELFYWDHFQRYGSVFKSRIFGKNFAFLIGAEANRLVLAEKADHLSARLGWIFLEPIFGKGLLLQDGAEHQATRRLMYPAMHGRSLQNYFDTIQEIVDKFFEDWQEGSTISLIEEFTNLSTTIAIRLILGTETESEFAEATQYFLGMLVGRRAKLKIDIPQTLYGRSQQARRNLQAFLRRKITQRKQQGALQESRDFLGLFLAAIDENGNSLSEADIIDQLLMVLFAGHENPAVLLSWLMFELVAHPEWCDHLRTEYAQVVGNEPLNLSHLKQLTQMGYALKEVERLYPPVQNMSRGVVKDIHYGGYCIPAGWHVDISPLLTHRLPEIYTDPDRFDPDRFAPPREEDKKHSFALVGFGSGPHSCLGWQFAQMEMKIILSKLLRYDWSVTPEPSAIVPVRQPSKFQDDLQAQIKKVLS